MRVYGGKIEPVKKEAVTDSAPLRQVFDKFTVNISRDSNGYDVYVEDLELVRLDMTQEELNAFLEQFKIRTIEGQPSQVVCEKMPPYGKEYKAEAKGSERALKRALMMSSDEE